MKMTQDWRTEYYKGMDVHVSVAPKDDLSRTWGYAVRVTEPGADTSADSELFAQSGDDKDYPSKDAAVQAGFAQGYAMVDTLIK